MHEKQRQQLNQIRQWLDHLENVDSLKTEMSNNRQRKHRKKTRPLTGKWNKKKLYLSSFRTRKHWWLSMTNEYPEKDNLHSMCPSLLHLKQEDRDQLIRIIICPEAHETKACRVCLSRRKGRWIRELDEWLSLRKGHHLIFLFKGLSSSPTPSCLVFSMTGFLSTSHPAGNSSRPSFIPLYTGHTQRSHFIWNGMNGWLKSKDKRTRITIMMMMTDSIPSKENHWNQRSLKRD